MPGDCPWGGGMGGFGIDWYIKNEGKGNRTNAAEALSDDEINILYEKNLLGISNGEALINTLWLFNSLQFGLRGCGEHR